MDDFARLAPKKRSDIIQIAAERKGLGIPIVEKHCWTCHPSRYHCPAVGVRVGLGE